MTTKPKLIHELVWTPKGSRIVKTKKEAARKMRAWRRWQQRRGWITHSVNGTEAVLAKPPDTFGSREAIILRSFDVKTHKRILPEPPPLLDVTVEKPKPEVIKQRKTYHKRKPSWA
jgi:hypothetical protein